MWHKLVYFIALLIFASVSTVKIEVQLERFEHMSRFDLMNATGVRVRKFNRTTWVMDGEGELFQDLGDEYSYTLTVAYSRLGNNQFNEYPLKVPKDKACNVVNGAYKEYQDYFLNWTNLPRVGDKRLCPLPKGHYWVKDFAPEGGWIPPVISEGYWRLTADFLDSEDNLATKLVVHLRIMKSYF